MTLVDAGPLVAILDRNDTEHGRCVAALRNLTTPLITTWPAFTEAIHLIGYSHGWHGQRALWEVLRRGDLELADIDGPLVERTHDLMRKYPDLPMDLADATLVAVAESRGIRRVFTLDRDFRVYRINGRKSFEIIP